MNKKFRMTPKELILNSKDYSNFTKDELIEQYEIIMNQYDNFKNQMTTDINSRINSPSIVDIKNASLLLKRRMYGEFY